MMIPTEPIGSIPRPPELIAALAARAAGALAEHERDALHEAAVRDTVARFEATGSPVITDGEQRKYYNFWTYPVHGAPNTLPDGFQIPFAAGDPRIETPELVRDRVLQAGDYIPLSQLGTTDDCGFAPFCDDNSTSRDTAFAKIRARIEGTALAAAILKDRP